MTTTRTPAEQQALRDLIKIAAITAAIITVAVTLHASDTLAACVTVLCLTTTKPWRHQ